MVGRVESECDLDLSFSSKWVKHRATHSKYQPHEPPRLACSPCILGRLKSSILVRPRRIQPPPHWAKCHIRPKRQLATPFSCRGSIKQKPIDYLKHPLHPPSPSTFDVHPPLTKPARGSDTSPKTTDESASGHILTLRTMAVEPEHSSLASLLVEGQFPSADGTSDAHADSTDAALLSCELTRGSVLDGKADGRPTRAVWCRSRPYSLAICAPAIPRRLVRPYSLRPGGSRVHRSRLQRLAAPRHQRGRWSKLRCVRPGRPVLHSPWGDGR